MASLRVNEIFYSIQGEGGRSGEPSIFIRLSGCDLSCGFCDTEFESGVELTLEEIQQRIEEFPCRWIIWTGGEPALQLTADTIAYFKERGYQQAIESNGNHSLPDGLDWVAISPKVAEHVLKRNFPEGVTELRYPRHAGHLDVPRPAIKAQYYYISPIFEGSEASAANLRHCLDLCLKNPTWRISVQLHKLLKVL